MVFNKYHLLKNIKKFERDKNMENTKKVWKKKQDKTCIDKTMKHNLNTYGECKKCGKIFAVYL